MVLYEAFENENPAASSSFRGTIHFIWAVGADWNIRENWSFFFFYLCKCQWFYQKLKILCVKLPSVYLSVWLAEMELCNWILHSDDCLLQSGVCVFYWSVVAAVSMLTTVLQSTAFKDWCTRVKKGGKSFHLSCLFTHTVTHKPL